MAKKCGRFSRRFWQPALSGVLGGPIGMSAYLLSIHYLTIYYAAPLSSLFPVFAALMSYWILKEKLPKQPNSDSPWLLFLLRCLLLK